MLPKIVSQKSLNAYNHVKDNDTIYDTCGLKVLGIASSTRFRATYNYCGGVWLTNGMTISGKVEKIGDDNGKLVKDE